MKIQRNLTSAIVILLFEWVIGIYSFGKFDEIALDQSQKAVNNKTDYKYVIKKIIVPVSSNNFEVIKDIINISSNVKIFLGRSL